MSNPGIRYERLLFWAAPITLSACAVFITTLGYNTYEDRVAANCFDAAAKVLDDNTKLLSDQWINVQREMKDPNRKTGFNAARSNYKSLVTTKLVYGVDAACWNTIDAKSLVTQADPTIFSADLRVLAADLRRQPVRMYGIDIPDVATLGIAGTKIQISMANFIQALQVALAPAMLLWLGSLYHTRFREIVAFKKHHNILAVHPHVINVFPVGHYPDLKRRNWLLFQAPKLWAGYYFFIRISLLLCFIAPSVGFYVGSLLYQPIFGYWIPNFIFSFSVGTYSLGVLLMELTAGVKHFEGEGALR
jgi:hypothetical protein